MGFTRWPDQGIYTPFQYKNTITELGRPDYDRAVKDWQGSYGEVLKGVAPAKELSEQFAPGGDFGKGRRQEARETIYGGVAKDTAMGVAAGMSSMASARGLNVRGARGLATQYGNIEDARAQLQVQAFTPYTQMLSNLTSIANARPTRGQYIDTIRTTGGTPRVKSVDPSRNHEADSSYGYK